MLPRLVGLGAAHTVGDDTSLTSDIYMYVLCAQVSNLSSVWQAVVLAPYQSGLIPLHSAYS